MDTVFGLLIICFLVWLFFRILRWLWPLIKFGAIFIAALAALGAWFTIKVNTPLGVILGAIAVVVGAWKYAKKKY